MRRVTCGTVALLCSLTSSTMAANACDIDIVINNVSRGDYQALDDVPLLTEKISIEKSNSLRDALTHSLIISPSETLDALKEIDNTIAQKGHDFVRDKFGTEAICSYVIDSNKYDRESFFKYYERASSNLKKIGTGAKSCLRLMDASVEEVVYEEKMGKMKWGNAKYAFD